MEISSPTVNPFMPGAALKILNPVRNEESETPASHEKYSTLKKEDDYIKMKSAKSGLVPQFISVAEKSGPVHNMTHVSESNKIVKSLETEQPDLEWDSKDTDINLSHIVSKHLANDATEYEFPGTVQSMENVSGSTNITAMEISNKLVISATETGATPSHMMREVLSILPQKAPETQVPSHIVREVLPQQVPLVKKETIMSKKSSTINSLSSSLIPSGQYQDVKNLGSDISGPKTKTPQDDVELDVLIAEMNTELLKLKPKNKQKAQKGNTVTATENQAQLNTTVESLDVGSKDSPILYEEPLYDLLLPVASKSNAKTHEYAILEESRKPDDAKYVANTTGLPKTKKNGKASSQFSSLYHTNVYDPPIKEDPQYQYAMPVPAAKKLNTHGQTKTREVMENSALKINHEYSILESIQTDKVVLQKHERLPPKEINGPDSHVYDTLEAPPAAGNKQKELGKPPSVKNTIVSEKVERSECNASSNEGIYAKIDSAHLARKKLRRMTESGVVSSSK